MFDATTINAFPYDTLGYGRMGGARSAISLSKIFQYAIFFPKDCALRSDKFV